MPTRDFADFQVRIEEVLKNLSSGIVLVLKGHLLLEKMLYQLVCSKCPNPEYLKRANLGFFHLLNLARALHPILTNDSERKLTTPELWDAMEALNTLRNRLAHHLEPEDLAPLFRRLKVGTFPEPISLDDPAIMTALGISIAFLLGTAAAFSGMTMSGIQTLAG
jgi:hypothetical protein